METSSAAQPSSPLSSITPGGTTADLDPHAEGSGQSDPVEGTSSSGVDKGKGKEIVR